MSDSPLTDRRLQAAHLLRRAGFGGSTTQINHLAELSHTEAVDKLLNYESYGPAFNLEGFQQQPDNSKKVETLDMGFWWLLTIANTRNPLQEKMTLFWHGHFTSSISKDQDPLLLLQQNELFRANAVGNFKELVKKVSRDPAMLFYLDGQFNRKGKPNENYARELMELFTIGIGNYTEEDVREAARAFTGWGFKGTSFDFNPALHDAGSKTFMGQTGNFNGDDIIDIIMARRETAQHITTKLWNFFAYPDPAPNIVEKLSDTFVNSNFSIKAVLREIFLSPEFLSTRAYRALVKSPVEYIVGLLNQLEVSNFDNFIAGYTATMGQTLFNPPDVKGWDGGLSWVNSSQLFERLNIANQVSLNRGKQALSVDLYSLLAKGGQALESSQKVVEGLLYLFLEGQLNPEAGKLLVDYLEAGSNPGQSAFVSAAAGKNKALDSRVRGVMHLILSSPDYNLA